MGTAGAYDGGIVPKADKDPTKEIQWEIQRAVANLWDGIIGAINAAVNAVKEWVMGLFGVVGNVIEWINPGQIIERILQALTGMSTSEVLDLLIHNPLAFLPTIIFNFIRNGLLGPNSPLSAFNIFGLLQSWNLPFLPLSSLTNQQPNLLVQPGFTLQDSINETSYGWEWDATEGRNDPGCARVDVLGGIQQILQTVPIPVAEGQKIKSHIWVKWAGLTYTGTNPILVDLVRLDPDGVEISKTTLKTLVNPAASSGGNWFQIDCPEYEIPVGNTAQILWQLRAPETATGGKIWWDDAELKKVNQGIPQNWVLNLLPDLGGIRQFIQDVVDAIIGAIRGFPIFGAGIADMILHLTGWREDTEITGAKAEDAYIGLGVTQKIITATAQGTPLPPEVIVTPADTVVMEALDAQTSAIVSLGAQVEQLQSQYTGNETSGNRALETFEEERTGSLNPALWETFVTSGSGAWLETADGHNVAMGFSGSPTATVMARYIGPDNHTQTNYQKVTANIARAMDYPFLDGRRPAHGVVCRMSDDKTKWVRAYYDNANRLIVDYRNGAASGQLLNTGQDWVRQPGPGSSLAIEPGVGTDPYLYRIWAGNTPLIIAEDPGHVTDITPLGHGIIMKVDGGWGPGAFTQYTAVDTKQIAIPGYGFRVYNSSGVVVTRGDSSKLDFFNIVQEDTDGGWDSFNQRYVIPERGWWTFKIRVGGSNATASGQVPVAALALYIGGAVAEYGGIGLRNSGWNGSPADSLNGQFGPYPLDKGAVIESYMAYVNGTPFRCIGDAGGTKTSFSGALISRSR